MSAAELRTSASLPPSADCVIVGGGVIGAATAFYARRAGLTPVVLEKRSELATLTTAAAAGGFRAQFDDADEIALMRESIAVFEHFSEHTGLDDWELGRRQQGYLWATTLADGPGVQLAAVERQRAHGLADVEQLDGTHARRRFPFLAPEVTSVRFRAADGWLDPVRLALGFAVASRGDICLDTEVTGFGFDGGRLSSVCTTRGEISCGTAVIAGGPFAARLAALAEVTLPIELMTRHKVFVPAVPEVPADAPMTIDEDTGAHWRPEGGGALLLCPHADAPTGPPLDHVPGSAVFALELLRDGGPLSVSRITPFWKQVTLRSPGYRMTSGQYALTPDRKPLLGATPRVGLYVNAGYSGHGIMGSAAGARIVVDTIVAPGSTRNPFALDRRMSSGLGADTPHRGAPHGRL